MALVNYNQREISAKLVYYGPGLSGKTTNIQFIHKKLRSEHRGKLMSLATKTDRTLFFDFLPVDLGEIQGFKTRFHLYTVPGQVFYNATRKLVLKNVDGVVFVADSQAHRMGSNIESLKNLEENLAEYGKDLKSMPFILQYNKRDLPHISTIEELHQKLNPANITFFEACASKGTGVLETLTTASKMVFKRLHEMSSTRLDSESPTEQEEEWDVEDKKKTGEELTEIPSDQLEVVEKTRQPAQAVPPQTEAGEALELLECGQPTKVSTGTFSLPLRFQVKSTGARYSTNITLRLGQLVSLSEEEDP